MSLLGGKNALVTGGGTGIGKAIAKRLYLEGASVTIIGRRKDTLEAAVTDISKDVRNGSGALRVLCCDVTSETEVSETLSKQNFPQGLDILVANAGTALPSPILDLDINSLTFCIDINVTGSALCIKYAARLMRGTGGSIITISSISAASPQKWMAPYSVSKAALEMLTRCAALELGQFRIRVNCIQPGLIQTEATEMAFPESLRNDFVSSMTLGGPGEPLEIASAVAFLASEESRWISGQIIAVNGGASVTTGEDWKDLATLFLDDDVVSNCFP